MVPKVGLARTLAAARRHAGAQTKDALCLSCFALCPFKSRNRIKKALANASALGAENGT